MLSEKFEIVFCCNDSWVKVLRVYFVRIFLVLSDRNAV